jgi:hypothetical protein
MTKTSMTDYVVGGIMASCVIAVFVFFYVSADINYDIEGIDTSGLISNYGNLTQMSKDLNETAGGVYGINVDSKWYDVLGGLLIKAFTAIKSFISGMAFIMYNTGNMLNVLHIPTPIILATSAIITVLIAGWFLFKYIAQKEDEK